MKTTKTQRASYDELPLVPSVIAQEICLEPYTGVEVSVRIRDYQQVAKVESLRRQMTLDQQERFIRHTDLKCRAAYESGDEDNYFHRCVKAKGNKGRDQLYQYVRHWLVSFLLVGDRP